MKQEVGKPQHERGFELIECRPEEWVKVQAMAAERRDAMEAFDAEFKVK